MADEFVSASKFRTLTGAPRALLRALLLALTLVGSLWALEIHHRLPVAFFNEQYLGLFLALALGSVFLAVKPRVKGPGDRVPWYDWMMAAGGLLVGLYVAVLYPTIAYRLGVLSPDRWLLGGLAILLVLEATRRLAGGTLAWVALGCILYANLAYLFPGPFYAKGSSWARIASYLYLDANGLLGLPLGVAASVVVAYIFFGQALYAVAGDKFLTDLALIATGRFRGGPAKVSVVSSALFGTVSGSAVANVVVDGAITIPLMKRAGFPGHLAAAIEAVASNGGQITPPVMGAAAFVMAEFLNLSYGQVALAAAIPAGLYYLALFTQIDLEAAKRGLAGLPADQIPKFRSVLRRGWVFLIPLLLLIYTLMIENWEPGKAGMVAVISVFLVGSLQRETRPTWRAVLTSIEETARTLLDIAVITALAGLVIGALHLSGLTFKISLLLVNLSGGNALVLLLVTAVGCLLLGLPLPTTVVYITLAVLVAPALTQLGILPLAAHLFLFYFGMVSLITPPDCLPVYIAAAIARANFWKTGWTAMRLGIAAYVVPFVFALHPPLILVGSAGEVGLAIVTASVGVVIIAMGAAGYLFYFGMVSLITPPDCLPVYIAAAIARANFWRTGWTAMRLGIAAYVVPFVFALHPPLILVGSAGEVGLAIVTASVGVVIIAMGAAGYLFRPLGWGRRTLLFVAGFLLLLPTWSGAWLLVDGAGLAIALCLVAWEWNATSPRRPIAVAAPDPS